MNERQGCRVSGFFLLLSNFKCIVADVNARSPNGSRDVFRLHLVGDGS